VIVPSIDISRGRAVQLVGGETVAIEAGDPFPLLERFAVVGEVAVIDIDAARGDGDNRRLIEELCRRGRVRVGGGIRDIETAIGWLDAGADRIIIGTAAKPGLLAQLPKDRVIVALDSRDGEVLSHGWRQTTGATVLEQVEEVKGNCGGFLVTFVEREGKLQGTDLERARDVIEAATPARVTIAGGISTAEEVASLDAIGADSQVGMAIYTGQLSLGDALGSLLRSDRPDGLWPTVVVNESGVALGLAWSSGESLSRAIDERRGVYRSRSRGIWVKGETSGATQELLRVDIDCDRDALRFTVRQHGPGFCHTGDHGCWGEDWGMGRLQRRISAIAADPPRTSNTARLLEESGLLSAKLLEEAAELGRATSPDDVTAEAADLAYFLTVKTAAAGVGWGHVEAELDRRELNVTRRPMVAKEGR
jgi:phosphoribosyl-AMP cyclohydrolase / phosphoribosyl-ATP pyrophosphohydrolase